VKLPAGKSPSHTFFGTCAALGWGGAVALALLGVALVRAGNSRPPRPVSPVEPGGSPLPPVAPPDASRGARASADVHLATQYLSTPKHEDVILTAATASLYALVLADGATSYRYNGGEYSGGGRHAAEIAAHTARTYLTRQLLPCLSVQDMLAHVQACFSAANTALEKHNASTPTPGGTTLMIALLWHGGKGRWYWVYGTLGNGLLELLHAPPLLAGWPIHTPLDGETDKWRNDDHDARLRHSRLSAGGGLHAPYARGSAGHGLRWSRTPGDGDEDIRQALLLELSLEADPS
jgi:hypothetical protein